MPKADWKKCAVCTALPTTQTSESQPDTGNGSVEASYSTSPTSCLSWSRSRSARRSSSLRVWSRLTAAPPTSYGVRHTLHTAYGSCTSGIPRSDRDVGIGQQRLEIAAQSVQLSTDPLATPPEVAAMPAARE